MPFPLLIPIIASLAGSVGGSLANKALSGGGKKGSSPSYNDTERSFLDTTRGIAETAMPFSKDFLGKAGESLGLSQDFWKSLMQMDPATLAQVFSPEISRIQKNKQQKIDTVSRFAPRGGERDRALTESRTDALSQISRLFSSARPMAAEGLSTVGGQFGSLGLGAGSLALGGASSGLDFLSARRNQNLQKGSAIGEGLGGLIGQLLPMLLGRGGSSGGGYSDPRITGG